jgi:hypothetical protein
MVTPLHPPLVPRDGVTLRVVAVCRAEENHLKERPLEAIVIPSVETVKAMARESFAGLAVESPDFGKLMRMLIPRIVVIPYRLPDGGMIVHSAKFRLHLSQLLPERRAADALQRPLEQFLMVDLFDPPQREAYRRRIMVLRASDMSEKAAAEACGITITAAQRAATLQRMMDALGLTDPYVAVTEPPDDFKRLRRHRHRRYRFEPLDGAGET